MNIVLLAPQYRLWGKLRPDSLYTPGTMVAGGETALVRLSQELAKQGHTVTVYAHTDQDADHDGVQWRKMQHLDEQTPLADAAISYDTPGILAQVQAHVKLVANQTNNPNMAGAPPIDGFVFCSAWHADAVRRCTPGIAADRCHVIGNGVDLDLYAARDTVPRVPGRILWTSSPDRGLHHALAIFARVHAALPHTTFHIYYDFHKAFDSSQWAMDYRTECLWQAKHLMDTLPGVTYKGPVDKRTLAAAQMEAELLLYSCDTPRPSEGYSIATLESMAAGCVPLISDCDALGELWGEHAPMLGLPIDYGQWTSAAVGLLGDAAARRAYQQQGYKRAAECTWERVGLEYSALLARLWSEKPCPCCGRLLGG